MRKIKLLHFFAPLRFGGGETFIINFFRASASRFENSVVLFSASPAFRRELDDPEQQVVVEDFLKIDMGSGAKSSYIKLFFLVFTHPFRLIGILKRKNDYDFIIGHGFPFNFLIPALKAFGFIHRGEKTVYFQHHRLMNSSGSALQRIIYRKLFSTFDIILANSRDVQNDILALDPSLDAKIIVYSVGLDFEYIRTWAQRSTGADIPIPAGRTTAVYPARFTPHKNHAAFLKIFSALKAAGAADKLFVVFSAGDGDAKESFRAALSAEGYSGSCFFPDRLDHGDLLRAIAASDICIFPSREEGFGLGILEALILGTPVLSLQSAIPAELGHFTVSAQTEDQFVKMAKGLVTDPDALAKAAETLQQNYDALKKAFDLRETSLHLGDVLSRFSVSRKI
jgi:glycosyltransferase involved in cell wall biosynthesis